MFKPTLLINIVLYNPDKDKLIGLLRICLAYESVKILLFDNSSYEQSPESMHSEKIIFYKSKKNVGVAGAHYYACKLAEAKNFDFVLFLDQDSLLPEDFINLLVLGFYRLQKLYPRLCAVGPLWKDPRIIGWYQEKEVKNNLKKRIKTKLKRILRVTQYREKMHQLLQLDNILISSGMMVWVPTLKDIGYPKKEYFIDLVDIEWCLRALSKNFQIEQVKNVKMQHTIGQFKSSKTRFLQYQSPMRYYYSIRNSFYLFRENKFPILFRLFILIRNIVEMKKIPFVPETKKSLLAAVSGIRDGIFMKKKLADFK
ncbi:MAG: glycosyltransferase [Gammaproteobacteria bacterium]|nr:MAG: glycosyltransferase [Gammaproteobacteria bacterium]